jgi:hypothetical protein
MQGIMAAAGLPVKGQPKGPSAPTAMDNTNADLATSTASSTAAPPSSATAASAALRVTGVKEEQEQEVCDGHWLHKVWIRI